MIDQPYKDILDAVKLQEFLSVKAPEVIIKRKSLIESEIGADGGEYTCTKTGKRVLTKFDSGNILCIEDDWSLTNNEGSTVFKAEDYVLNQTRPADNINDFAEIYQREFLANKLVESTSHHDVLKLQLKEKIENLKALHCSNRQIDEGRNLTLIAKAKDFLAWLPDYVMPRLSADELLNIDDIEAIFDRFKGKIFEPISLTEFSKSVQNPSEHNKIKFKKDKASDGMGIVRYFAGKIAGDSKKKEWLNSMLENLNIEKDNYNKASLRNLNKLKLD